MTLKQATEAVEKARWSEAMKISNGLKKAGVSCRPKIINAYLQESCDALMRRCEGTATIQNGGVMPMAGESERTRLYAAMTSQISWVASEEERKNLEEGLLDMIRYEKYMERIVDRLSTTFHRRKGNRSVLVEPTRLQSVFDRLYKEVTTHKGKDRFPCAKPRHEPSDFDGSRGDVARAVLQRINAPFSITADGKREDRGEGHPTDKDPLTLLIEAEDKIQAEKKVLDQLLTRLMDVKKCGDKAEYDRIIEVVRTNDPDTLVKILGESATQTEKD